VPQAILIDTDTALDDAVALIMALRSENARVIAITTVAGNVHVHQATQNALYTAELCDASTPVYQGAEKPLAQDLIIADWFHGKDGLGDHGYPAPRRSAEKQHAVEAIIDTVRGNPGLTLVTLGPLTNIALSLAQAPDLVRHVGRCVIMGGAPCCEGNVTPAAEYNMWVDPEAARAQTGEDGISLPDPVAMSIALDPTIGTESSQHYVDIETATELTRGMTVVDRLGVASDERNRATWAELVDRVPKTKVYWAIDAARWKQALYSALSS